VALRAGIFYCAEWQGGCLWCLQYVYGNVGCRNISDVRRGVDSQKGCLQLDLLAMSVD